MCQINNIRLCDAKNAAEVAATTSALLSSLQVACCAVLSAVNPPFLFSLLAASWSLALCPKACNACQLTKTGYPTAFTTPMTLSLRKGSGKI